LLQRINDEELRTISREGNARIADLAAGLAIERRLIGDESSFLPRADFINGLAVHKQCNHLAFGNLGFIAEELGRTELVAQFEPDGFGRLCPGARPGRAGILALLRHRRIETGLIAAHAARAQRSLRQIKREAIGVIKAERYLTRQYASGAKFLDFIIKKLQA